MSQRTVATACLVAMLVSASPAQSTKAKGLSLEFDKLRNEYAKAQEKYYEPFNKAKSEEEMMKIRLDPAKNPDKLFGPRLLALAKRAVNVPTVFPKAGMLALRLTINNGDRKNSDWLIDNLIARAVDSRDFLGGIYNLQGYTYAFAMTEPEKEKWLVGKYDLIRSKAKDRSVQAGALAMKAEFYAPDFGPMRDEAKGVMLFNKLRDQYPETEPGKRAVNALFRIQNLQVGKVAPDFTISDENGVDWKLSDYRGKVVVLDFWGFW